MQMLKISGDYQSNQQFPINQANSNQPQHQVFQQPLPQPQPAYLAVPLMQVLAYPMMPGQLPVAYGGYVPQPVGNQQTMFIPVPQQETPTQKQPKQKKNNENGKFKQKESANGSHKQGQATWLKYKTSLCRHWEQTQTCSLAGMCSFAHGQNELRKINDPMPENFPGRNSVGALLSNYKTQICRNFEETGLCKFGSHCCYAHGKEQLRSLIDPMPPVPSDVMLYNPTNARQMGANSTHVQAPYSSFKGQRVPLQDNALGSDLEEKVDLDQTTAAFEYKKSTRKSTAQDVSPYHQKHLTSRDDDDDSQCMAYEKMIVMQPQDQ